MTLSTWLIISAAVLLSVLLGLLPVLQPSAVVAAILVSSVVLPLLVLSLRRLELRSSTIAIIIAGLALYGLYLSYTTFGERNQDAGAQLKYIEYIVNHRAIPPKEHCYICHHPPLYYLLAAAGYRYYAACGFGEAVTGSQLISLIITLFFLVYSVLIFKRFTRKLAVINLATALTVFWPYTIINSVRVHNDALVCPLMTIGLFYLVKWYQDDRLRDLGFACATAILAVITKSNGYIFVGTIFLACAYSFFFRRRGSRLRLLKRVGAVLLVMTAALSVNAFVIRSKQADNMAGSVLGTAWENRGDHVGVEPHNFFYFDVESFIKEPYVLASKDGYGRQYFWNHLIKSSLFSTHNTVADPETAYAFNKRVAGIMSFLVLAMLVHSGLGLLFMKKERLGRYVVLYINAALLLGLIALFRLMVPAPHHSDYRLIFSFTPIMSLAFALTVDLFRERSSALKAVGHALALPFVLLSVVYFWPKYDLVLQLSSPVFIHRKASEVSRIVQANTPWDKEPNIIILGGHIVRITMDQAMDVGFIDVSLDNNDRYEVTLFGRGESRRISLGPSDAKGMARYRQPVVPPVRDVQVISVRPIIGDLRYSLGHIVASPPDPAAKPAPPWSPPRPGQRPRNR